MPDPLHKQLLSQATRLAALDPKRPQQANLRRAISTAYYALFHFLVDEATKTMIGTANERRVFRNYLARGFQHSDMRDACKSFIETNPGANTAPGLVAAGPSDSTIRLVAQVFGEAQQKRHDADYNRTKPATRADALATINSVSHAIRAIKPLLPEPKVKFFLCCLICWRNLKGRN